MTECQWIGPCPDTFFVIPKLRSWLAVDLKLLSFVNSQLLHQTASFQSVFRVWVDMHPESVQQDLLRGATGTLERNNTQRLADAWMTWSATTWADGSDGDVPWDFSSPESFDKTLSAYKDLLDDALFNSVVKHIPDCPRCGHLLALITDGKVGACRRVCSNLNKFLKIPQLGAVVHTGCDAHVDSNHLYCSGCDPASAPAQDVGGVGARQIRVLEARACPDLANPGLRYKVEFDDGVARMMRREDVLPELVQFFETRRWRRKCTRQRKDRFDASAQAAKCRKGNKALAPKTRDVAAQEARWSEMTHHKQLAQKQYELRWR